MEGLEGLIGLLQYQNMGRNERQGLDRALLIQIAD